MEYRSTKTEQQDREQGGTHRGSILGLLLTESSGRCLCNRIDEMLDRLPSVAIFGDVLPLHVEE